MPGRMTKLGRDETGITVDGEDYKDFLARKEKKEKEDEVETERKNEIGTKTKHKKKLKPRERYEDDPRRVSKRVTRLSDFEIRREYGIMALPFKSLTQNVLYVLFNAGETLINSRAISNELEKNLPDVSSVLSGIWKKLNEDDLIFRQKLGLAYQYRITERGLEMGFDPLFRKYFPPQGGVRKKKEVEPAPVEDPRLKGVYKYLKEQTDMIFKRVEALEQDGLADKVQAMVGVFEDFKQGVNDDIRDIFNVENRPPGEFNINFNVRFMFGGR